MLTNTHMLVAAAATGRPQFKWYHLTLAWLGGVLPDFNIVVMIAWSRLTGFTGNMWREPGGLYWQQPWQAISAVVNSMPLWASGLALGYWIFRASVKFKEWGRGMMILCGGCLLHVIADFPVHTDDAHVHFWPFTDWRFHSPVSYYQRAHYGDIVGAIEVVVGVALAAFIFWRFKQWPMRAMAVLMIVPYFLSVGFMFFRS